jgi:hypothetical protein
MTMSDEIRGTDKSDTETSPRKQAWTQPCIESVQGREARGSIFSYGGPDGGFYS